MSHQPAILYVEDDPQSQRLMQILLEVRMGLEHVTILEDSKNFVERVQALDPKPDLIFLDIHVKPYSGFDMLAMLRELDWIENTRVIALTASVMNEEVHQLHEAGFDGCLAKPIDLSTFPDMVARILNGEAIWRIIN